MLRNIPNCISPDLMHTLMSMAHGDELVLGDKRAVEPLWEAMRI